MFWTTLLTFFLQHRDKILNQLGEKLQKRVIKLLKMDPSDDSKRAVVIYGFGGIGKTTLASAVFKNLDLKAYKYCRLDIDANCSNDDIKRLQQQMLRDLFGQENVLLNSCQHGQDQLTEAFIARDRRIFMFIDNALGADNLLKLLPADLSCLPSGMRILLTTRKLDETDKLSGTDLERITYKVDALSPSDSKRLLCKIALGSPNASLPPGIDSIDVQEIGNICNGIPLLVELVAHKFKKFLARPSEVKSLMEFLKESVATGGDIERVVDEVYQSLDELSMEAFLDIVCFLDKYEERTVSAAVGKVQLQVLQDAALVKLSFDDNIEKFCPIVWDTEKETPQIFQEDRNVKVHDIIKARGRWLSQQDKILELESLKDAVQDRQKLQKIKGIEISASAVSDEFEIKAESLDVMHSSLRVLRLPKSIKVDGICERSFQSLKFLAIDGNLPVHPKQLKRLAVLRGSDGNGADSEKIDELPASLQFLHLRDSANLPTLLQSFHNLCSLQHLHLQGCDALVSIPTSFGQLKSLTVLNLSGCGNITTLPENIGDLSALQFLDLSGCTKLASIPLTLGHLKCLQLRYMVDCSELTFSPDSFDNMSTLQILHLKGCEKVVELPKSFVALSALKYLNLSGCSNLESLPDSFGQLKSLKLLLISECHNLKTLNGGFRSLTSLMLLDASDCESLEEEAVDSLVEIKSLLLVNMDESPSLIQRWKQIGHRYPLIVRDVGDDGEFLHTVEYTLLHGGSRFVGVEGDGEQLVDWSWPCFAGEAEEEEVEVSVLLTMCDLSLECNNSALQKVRKEIERRMEESRGKRKFQIVYAEAGDSLEKSEENIRRQTLLKLLPTCTCACMPADNRTSQLFVFALYSVLQPESRYAIQSLHTCIFGLIVRRQRDRKWVEIQRECFLNDIKETDEWETLVDQAGGFSRLFSTLDILYSGYSDD